MRVLTELFFEGDCVLGAEYLLRELFCFNDLLKVLVLRVVCTLLLGFACLTYSLLVRGCLEGKLWYDFGF